MSRVFKSEFITVTVVTTAAAAATPATAVVVASIGKDSV